MLNNNCGTSHSWLVPSFKWNVFNIPIEYGFDTELVDFIVSGIVEENAIIAQIEKEQLHDIMLRKVIFMPSITTHYVHSEDVNQKLSSKEKDYLKDNKII